MRAPLAVVNEASLPPLAPPLSVDQVIEVLGDFVDVVRRAQDVRADIALAAAAPLGSVPLTADGLSFGTIAATTGGSVLDRWRYIQARRNIAPFSSSADVQVPPLDEEFSVDGIPTLGLGVAATSDQLAVSFRTGAVWEADTLLVNRLRLVEDEESGDLVEEQAEVPVRHASHHAHIDAHAQFIGDLALPDPFSGADLWSDRTARYPGLEFLDGAEDHLRSLGAGSAAVRQVHERLCELSVAAMSWKPAEAAFPTWASYVTPEAEQRKKLCMFTDVDGETRCFDLHARFTPGAGRIHFRLLPEVGRLRVAYVGPKIGA